MVQLIRNDLRHGIRRLRAAPQFTLAAIVILALGIGLNTGLYTMLRVAFLNPWPVDDVDQLLWVSGRSSGSAGVPSLPFGEYETLRDRTRAFSSLAAVRWGASALALERGAAPDSMSAGYVSGNFFRTVGMRPVLGRVLMPSDDVTGAPPVAMVSERWWRRRLGGDPGAIGRTLVIRDQPVTLVGVVAHRHAAVSPNSVATDLWLPIATFEAMVPGVVREQGVWVLGRLAGGTAVQAAQSELDALTRDTYRNSGRSLPGVVLAGTTRGLPRNSIGYVAADAALLVLLLLMCANLGNLQLTRTLRRGRDFAIRLSLGATHAQLARQILIESVLLAGAGALAGLIAVRLVLPSLERLSDPRATLPTWIPDASVVAFAVALALAASLVTAAASWRRATRFTFRVAGPHAQFERSGQAARSILLAVQVAMCVTLVGTTALLARGIVHATSLDPGFELDNVLAVDVQPPRDAGLARAALTQRLVATLQARGFARLGIVDLLPMDRSNLVMSVRHPGQAPADQQTVSLFPMSAEAFDVLGIPLIAGRHARADATPREMVVNQSFATQLFGGNALDRTVIDRQREYHIVGIVADAQLTELAQVRPTAHPQPFLGSTRLVLRSTASPAVVEQFVRAIDPRLRVSVLALRDVTYASLARARQGALMAAGTALLGLALACLGLYAVFGAVVEERRREIGVRIALGARPRHVIRQVVGSAMIATGCGLCIGFAFATAAGFALRGFLYRLAPVDAQAGLTVMAILAGAALLSAYLPARRSTLIDPAVTLRAE